MPFGLLVRATLAVIGFRLRHCACGNPVATALFIGEMKGMLDSILAELPPDQRYRVQPLRDHLDRLPAALAAVPCGNGNLVLFDSLDRLQECLVLTALALEHIPASALVAA